MAGFGLLIALGAAFAFATFSLLSRVLLKESENPLAFAVIYGAFTAIASFLFIPMEPWRFFGISEGILFITFIATILFAAFEATEFFARKHLEASRLTILFQLTPVVTFLASLVFLQETFSFRKVLAIALIIGGNLIAIYKHEGKVTKIGLLFGLGTAFALGLAYVADKAVFQHYPLPLYMALTYGLPALYILPLLGKNRAQKLRQELERVSWKLPILGLISVTGYYLVLKTFQLLEVSIAIPIIFTSTILTTLGGILILKEKSNIFQKFCGVIIVFIGVILIN